MFVALVTQRVQHMRHIMLSYVACPTPPFQVIS